MYIEAKVMEEIGEAYQKCYGKDMPPVTGLAVPKDQQIDKYRGTENGIIEILFEFPNVAITSARPEYLIIDIPESLQAIQPRSAEAFVVSDESVKVLLYREPYEDNGAVEIKPYRNLLAIQVCFNFKDIYGKCEGLTDEERIEVGMEEEEYHPFSVSPVPLYKD